MWLCVVVCAMLRGFVVCVCACAWLVVRARACLIGGLCVRNVVWLCMWLRVSACACSFVCVFVCLLVCLFVGLCY